MSDTQRSPIERHQNNELLGLAAQREGVYSVGTDNALFAARATRPAVMEQVLWELNNPPVEAHEIQPAASAIVGAAVETTPASATATIPEKSMLQEDGEPDIVDREAYYRAMETGVGQQVDEAFAEQAMAPQVDASFEDQARAMVDAVFDYQGGEQAMYADPE